MTEKINNNRSEEDISLKEIVLGLKNWIFYLLAKWRFLVSLGLLGSIVGLGYSFMKKSVYTADTTFVLEDGKSTGGGVLANLGGLASIAGVDLGGRGGIFEGDNIIELYKSRKMVEKTLLSEVEIDGKKQQLVERYIEVNGLRKNWNKKENLKGINFIDIKFNRLQDSLMNLIIKDINDGVLKISKPDKKLSIIKVSVVFDDEFFAKNFNDQIVKNVNDFYIQTKTKKALENISSLQKQTDSVRNVMFGAITTTSSVADATPNLNPVRQVLRSSGQKSQVNAEANKAVLSTLIQNLELAKLSLLNETPLIQVIDMPIYPLKVDRLGKVKAMVLGGLIFSISGMLIIILRVLYKRILEE